NHRSNQIHFTCHPENTGQNAERVEDQGISQDAPRGGPSIFRDDRQHANSTARVILAIKPSDGEEMRELPREKNGEQYQRAPLQMAPCRCPTQNSGHRSRKSTNESAEGGDALQGCVSGEVHRRSQKSKKSRQRIAENCQVEGASYRGQ